ncbi:MAG: amidohydrolase family protein [Acidobacteria bacterium]|nr:amidohydrolase family protein [Acidobacteriota bacterium]
MLRTSTRLAAVAVLSVLSVVAFVVDRPAAQGQGGVTALTGVRIIDGTGRAPIEQGTIVIGNGRITAAGASSSVQVPAGATRVDLSGKTVMPGMVNAHAHPQNQTKTMPMRGDITRRLRMYANYGVTTAVSLGQVSDEETAEVVKLRDEQDRPGPGLDRARVYTSGPSIRGLKTVDEVRKTVDRYVDMMKVDRIKTHVTPQMTPDQYAALIDEGHKRGLRVNAHIFSLAEAKMVFDRGVDVIAHSIRDQDVPASFAADLKRRNIGYIPTLTRDLSVFVYESTPAFLKDPFFLKGMSVYGEQVKLVTDPTFQEKVRNDKNAQSIKQALEQANRNLKILSDAGVTIGMGTDSGTDEGRWPGYFEQVEIEMMAKAGMSPMQVIVAATSGAATVSKLDQVGTIAPGKAADLLVLDANPLQDIRNTRQINSVWIAGRRLGASGTN